MKITRILIFAFIFLSLIFHHTTLALKPQRDYLARPSDYGIMYREVVFTTSDGLSIKAWFYPAQDTTGIANELIGRLLPVPPELKRATRPYSVPDNLRHPTVVICLADAGNMQFLIFYAYHLFTRGFNVLTFDWRGFGESSDWPIDPDHLSYTEFLLDYQAALDGVKKFPEVDSTRIGLFGYSTGAYLSFAMATHRQDITALACRALMTSFKDLLSVIAPLDTTRHFKAPPHYPPHLEPIQAAEQLKIPVLLIVGEKDNRTPVWMSEQVYNKLTAAKDLWIVPGAEHGGMNGPESYNYPEFFIRLAEFFKKYLMK